MDDNKLKVKIDNKKRVVIVLLRERPPSWNKYYSSNMHWTMRRDITIDIHRTVRAELIQQGFKVQGVMFTKPVKITVLVYFESRPLDASNIPVKLYEDGLKGILIADDSPAYVRSVEAVTLIDKDNPRVEIIVEEVQSSAQNNQSPFRRLYGLDIRLTALNDILLYTCPA